MVGFVKTALLRSYNVICCLNCHQLHQNHKIRISTKSTQHGHDIALFRSSNTFSYLLCAHIHNINRQCALGHERNGVFHAHDDDALLLKPPIHDANCNMQLLACNRIASCVLEMLPVASSVKLLQANKIVVSSLQHVARSFKGFTGDAARGNLSRCGDFYTCSRTQR